MPKLLLELGGAYPWIRRHTCLNPPTLEKITSELVLLPSNQLGIIDHLKSDGMVGVRPLTDAGDFFPNPSEHWTWAQRMAQPLELSINPKALLPVPPGRIPQAFLDGTKSVPSMKNRLFK